MSSHSKKADRPLLISSILLVVSGFFLFSSASLGLLAREEGVFRSSTFSQIWLGLVGGMIAMIIASKIDYRIWKKYSLPIFIGGVLLLIALFIPGIGFLYNGARRWIHVGTLFSFQPSEIFKICFVIFWAGWISHVKSQITTFKFGTAPLLVLLAVSGGLILAQPDTATFGIIAMAGVGMFVAAGARWRDIFGIALTGMICLAILAFARPYVMDRIQTMINPASDPFGSGYQIQQSMIAIGSGGITGKGFGQSVQKFNFLPESNSDSIFAVAGEEFGLIGCSFIVLLFLVFALRGLKVASEISDPFGRSLMIGMVILVISGSFVNIASMVGLLPVTGVPLVFMSKGGTALFIALFQVGIMLNISKHAK